jgi:hypothetical protein
MGLAYHVQIFHTADGIRGLRGTEEKLAQYLKQSGFTFSRDSCNIISFKSCPELNNLPGSSARPDFYLHTFKKRGKEDTMRNIVLIENDEWQHRYC